MKRSAKWMALLWLWVSWATIPSALAGKGRVADSLVFHDLAGATHTTAELRGHPAVVNFWATWCGPCRDELPRLQKLSEDYAGQHIQFVAVSLDDEKTVGNVGSAVQKSGLHFPVWTGATDRTLSDLKLGILVPATLMLDEHGAVIGKIEGEAKDKDIRLRLDWLLGGRQGKQPKIVQHNG